MLTNTIKEILDEGSPSEVRALFEFNKDTELEMIRRKFNIWARWFFPKYFGYPDAPKHKKIDLRNIAVYVGRDKEYLDIAGRGLAKTARTKLFLAYAVANDTQYRQHIKILSEDVANAKQSSTDIYNMLISKRVIALYPEIFEKSGKIKREETMGAFTTSTGVKLTAEPLRTSQRGDIQEYSRPDLIWFDDFETKKTLRSATTTQEIWDNMEEAKNGLSKDGGTIYTCNYISERGNAHKLHKTVPNQTIFSIEDEEAGERYIPAWPERDTPEDLKTLEREVNRTPSGDYAGEYRCRPEISQAAFFDRESLERQKPKKPTKEVAGMKIYREYNPSHRIASGHDVGKGVGLDYSTSVFLDFDTNPIQVIATYKNNEISPRNFAYEIIRQAQRFGENYVAVEKNYGSTIDILVENYDTGQLHRTESHRPKIVQGTPTEYGWDTNPNTKNTMLNDLSNAIENGWIELNDPDLIDELKSYTRDDLMDKEPDPRLIEGHHFDLLIACAIAYQMNEYVEKPEVTPPSDPMLERLMSEKQEKENPAL